MFKTLRSRMVSSYILVVFISLGLLSLLFYQFLVTYTIRIKMKELATQAVTIARLVERLDGKRAPLEISKLLTVQGKLIGARVLLIDSQGWIIADSAGFRGLPKRYRLPPKVTAPPAEEQMRIKRHYLPELGKEILLVNVPLKSPHNSGNSVILIKPIGEIKKAQRPFLSLLLVAALISSFISILIGLYLSHSVTQPVIRLTRAAGEMAKGRFDQYIKVESGDEIGRLAKTFNYMAERIRRTHQAQKDFVANVSHEIRTPLTSIEGFSQALLDGTAKGKESFQRSLQIINQESKRLVRLLKDLLALSSIDAGQLDLHWKPVNLKKSLKHVTERFKPKAERNDIRFQVDIEDDMEIVTDLDRLEQAITNLLDNAFKYTPSGGEITLRGMKIDSNLKLEITDTGVGIPPEDLPKIFDRFYRAEKSRSQEFGGAGLGLSICKEIVEALGGDISVESKLNEGTKFTIVLPISPSH